MKRTLLKIHLWLGVAIGALWAVQGLTGALLVFNRDIQGTYFARPASAQALLPLDEIVTQAQTFAHAPVTRLETFGARPWLLLAYYHAHGGTRTLVIDGRTGEVVDDRNPSAMIPRGGDFWPWLLRLHEALLAGDRGQMFIGVSGLFLVASVGIGLWNAWPKRGRWSDVFRIRRWRKLDHRFFGWHKMIGFLAVPALLIMGASGIYLAFAPQLRPILSDRAGYTMPFVPRPLSALPAHMISAQRAFAIAVRRYPGARLVRMVEPSRTAPIFQFRLLQPGEWRRWAGTTTVAIDPVNGDVINTLDAIHGPLANRITDDIYPVHTGAVGGMFSRILVVFAGLSLPTFFVTGLTTWIRKRRRRQRSKSNALHPARMARASDS